MRGKSAAKENVQQAYRQQTLVSENTSVLVKGSYVPDSKRACIDDREETIRGLRSGTQKLRKDEKKDEVNHDCGSRA